jgi:hypothetical protein
MKVRVLFAIALTLLPAGAFIGGIAFEKKSSQKILNLDLAKAFGLLESDLDSWRRHFSDECSPLHEDPANKTLVPLTDKLTALATKEELQARLLKIRSSILHAIQTHSASEEAQRGTWRSSPFLVKSGQPFSWEKTEKSTPLGISLKNKGPDTVTRVRVQLDGKQTPVSIAEILETCLAGKSTAEEKALSLWSFVCKNRSHDWPSHPGNEAFDPVKLVSVYGYGFCSHAAKALAILAHHAGLESRVRQAKSQHVVCEILIDGHWAMFDPDGEVFYRFEDGRIASVEDIAQSPQLLLSTKSPIYSVEKLQDIFTNHIFITTPLEKFARFSPHIILPTLRPGEELEISKQKKGLFFASRYLEVPKDYANGAWRYQPIWSCEDTIPEGLALANVRIGSKDGIPELFMNDPEAETSITCFFDLPYPALRTEVQWDFPSDHSKEISSKVMASRDGHTWIDAEQIERNDKTIHVFSDFPNRLTGDPDYKFRVKLMIPPRAKINAFPEFRISHDLQMAPRSLPIPDYNGSRLCVNYEPVENQQIEITLISKPGHTPVHESN